MAIEIIREGQLPGKKPYEGTCSYCKTQIKCLQEDGKLHPARDQRDDTYLEVDCPKCHTKIHAYPLKGGSYIPQSSRSSLAWQIDAVENGRVIER